MCRIIGKRRSKLHKKSQMSLASLPLKKKKKAKYDFNFVGYTYVVNLVSGALQNKRQEAMTLY